MFKVFLSRLGCEHTEILIHSIVVVVVSDVEFRSSEVRHLKNFSNYRHDTYTHIFRMCGRDGTQTRRRPSGIKSLLYPSLISSRGWINLI